MNTASLRMRPAVLSSAARDAAGDLATRPRQAQIYVGVVIALGATALVALFPPACPKPTLFLLFLAVSSAAAAFKISLPLSKGGSTMSVSYASDFTALLLMGPGQTMIISMVSGWAQCAFNTTNGKRTPAVQTIFSMSTLVLTTQAAGFVYQLLGGRFGDFDGHSVAESLVGAGATYFLVNTLLIATAIALSNRQSIRAVWLESFLWAGPSYFVGAGTAAVLATLIDRTGPWFAILAAAPVYLTHRTYQIYLGRMEDEQRHVHQISELHWATMEALELAQRSERALTSEKERLAITLRSIGDGVITTDTAGRVVMLNHTAEQLTGWAQVDAAGRFLSDIVRLTDDSDGDTRADEPSGDRPRRGLLQTRDGASRVIERIATSIHDRDHHDIGTVLVIRDVTDAVTLEQERLKASKLESLGVLAGGIAHDFNNILLAIAGNLSLASLTAGDEPTARRLADAEGACLRARGLTQQLLTFSKGGAPIRQRTAIGPLVDDWSRFALRGSNVNCATDIAPDLWAVDADEGQISQVINNIVLNAKQAMPCGGTVTVTAANIRIEPGTRPVGFDAPDGRYVRISITDEGPGIPDECRRRIFDPYYTTKPKGTGLGLASCYSIVTRHEGHIGVESVPGAGATFHVYLPAATPREGATAEPVRDALFTGHGRILVMDDEECVRAVAADMLSYLGYTVQTASDGRHALALYQAERDAGRPFDAVIMDLTVPGGMGGVEAMRELRAIDPAVRAIASSGYADDPVMAEHTRYGFQGVIPKPFAVRDLGRAVQGLNLPPAVAEEARQTMSIERHAGTAVDTPRPQRAPDAAGMPLRLDASLEIAERNHILRALRDASGNKAMAARRLGVSRRTLYRRLQKHDLRTVTAVTGVSGGDSYTLSSDPILSAGEPEA